MYENTLNLSSIRIYIGALQGLLLTFFSCSYAVYTVKKWYFIYLVYPSFWNVWKSDTGIILIISTQSAGNEMLTRLSAPDRSKYSLHLWGTDKRKRSNS